MAALAPPKLSDRVGDLAPPRLSDRVDGALVEHPELDPGPRPMPPALGAALDRTAQATSVIPALPDVEAPVARKAVQAASILGVTPEFALQNLKEFDKKVDDLRYLNGLPRLTSYANQSGPHARSVMDDLDNLGVLEFALGPKSSLRFETLEPPDDGLRARATYLSGGPLEGRLRDPSTAPAWLLEAGRSFYDQISTLKTFWEMKFGGGVNMERVHKERSEIENVQLGRYTPAARVLVGGERVAQNLAPYMVHPGVAFGLMYADGTARTYEALRRFGYGDQEAQDVGETVGFTSAAVGTLLGGQLFGSIFPKVAMSAIGDAAPSALLRAVADRPAFWKFVRDVGVNQYHAALMNVGMAAAESGLLRAYDAYTGRSKFSLSGFANDVDRAALGSFQLMPLSIWAATKQAGQRYRLYEEGGPLREFNKRQAESQEVEQRIYDEYERQGHALRSLKAAGDLAASVEAVKRSKFIQESPEEGKKLIKSMLSPGRSQSVFVDPEALVGLPEAELSKLGVRNLAESMVSGSRAEVSIFDFLMTPSADSLLSKTAPAADLLDPREAAKNADPPPPVDLIRLMAQRDHIAANEPETPERRAKLDALNEGMRAVAAQSPLSDEQWARLDAGSKPTPGKDEVKYKLGPDDDAAMLATVFRALKSQGLSSAEIAARVDRGLSASDVDRVADTPLPGANSDSVVRLAPQEPAPQVLTAAEEIKKPPGPMLGFRGKLSRERLKAWAEGEVEDRPIGSYDSTARQHARASTEAEDQAAKLQEQISADLARASKKAKKGVEHGVESGESGRTGAEAALAGDTTVGAVKNWVDRSLNFSNRAEDKGVAAVKEEVKAGDRAKQIPRLQKIAKVNEAMAKALKDAQEEAGELKSKINDVDSGAAYRGGWEYGTAVDAITEALGGERRGYAAPDVSDAYRKMRDDGLVATFDLREVNRLVGDPRGLDDLTLPQVRRVWDALDQISKSAEVSAQVRAGEWSRDKEALRDQVIRHLAKLPFVPRGQGHNLDQSDSLTLGQRFGKKKAEFQSELNQPYTIFAKMGEAGDKLWFDGFVPAAVREERLHQKLMPKLQAVEEGFPEEVRATGRDAVQPPPGAPSEWGWFTRANVWRMLLYLGTKSGIEKISKGAGISPVNLVSWAQANMARDPAHVPIIMEKFIEPTWKIFNDLWEEYGPSLRERGLSPPKKLDAEPFVVGDRTYSGGYGGRLRWMGLRGGDPVDPESTAALLGLDFHGPSTPQQHLRDRTEASGVPDLHIGGIGASLRAEIHDLAFHGFAENTLKLLSDPLLRKTLDDKVGKQFVDQLYSPDNKISWLHVVAQGRIPDLNSLSLTGVISNLQGRAAISAFALNFRVMAMQLSHEFAFAAGTFSNPLPMARAFSAERRAWAESVSQILPYRQNNFEQKNTDLTYQLTGVRPGEGLIASTVPGAAEAQQALNKFNWEIWRVLDGRLSHGLWEMGLHDAMSRGLSGELAIRAADKFVQRGAPSQTIYEQSAFVRDRKFLGLMFLVRNFPNVLYNVAALEAWEGRVRGGSAISTGAKYLGMVLAAEVIGKGVLGGHLPGQGGNDEDLDAWLARNAVRALFYPIYLDAPAEAAGHLAAGNRREAARSLEHMTPAAISLGSRFMLDLGDAVSRDDERGIRAVLDVLGVTTRTPIPRLADWAKAYLESSGGAEFVGRGAGYLRGD